MERLPLERALERYRAACPELAERAASALRKLLEGVEQSRWPEVAWQFSHLTGDGYPVELSFTSSGEAIRYAVDASGPESSPEHRLRRAMTLIGELGEAEDGASSRQYSGDCAKASIERLHTIQSGGRLDYGAWASGRHSSDGDEFKLYAEVPRGGSPIADEWVRSIVGERPFLLDRTPVLRMIGLEPATGRLEFYFRADRLLAWEVSRMMGMLGLTDQAEPLLDLAQEIAESSASASLPCTRNGFSLAVGADGAPDAFCLFSPAKSLAGTDRRIRARLLAAAERRSWRLAHYAAISAPLAEREGPGTKHGIVTFAAAQGRPPQLCVGLRPI